MSSVSVYETCKNIMCHDFEKYNRDFIKFINNILLANATNKDIYIHFTYDKVNDIFDFGKYKLNKNTYNKFIIYYKLNGFKVTTHNNFCTGYVIFELI